MKMAHQCTWLSTTRPSKDGMLASSSAHTKQSHHHTTHCTPRTCHAATDDTGCKRTPLNPASPVCAQQALKVHMHCKKVCCSMHSAEDSKAGTQWPHECGRPTLHARTKVVSAVISNKHHNPGALQLVSVVIATIPTSQLLQLVHKQRTNFVLWIPSLPYTVCCC